MHHQSDFKIEFNVMINAPGTQKGEETPLLQDTAVCTAGTTSLSDLGKNVKPIEEEMNLINARLLQFSRIFTQIKYHRLFLILIHFSQ